MRKRASAISVTRGVLLWIALALVALGGIGACASTTDESPPIAQESAQEAEGEQRIDAATEQVSALYPSGGNSCSAPANQGCSSCQVSCPSDHVAYCAPGHGWQVLNNAGLWEWRCSNGPTCSCTKPK